MNLRGRGGAAAGDGGGERSDDASKSRRRTPLRAWPRALFLVLLLLLLALTFDAFFEASDAQPRNAGGGRLRRAGAATAQLRRGGDAVGQPRRVKHGPAAHHPPPLGSRPKPPPATPAEMAAWVDAPQTTAPQRQRFVAGMVSWAWHGYASSALGHDELHPLSRDGSDWLGLGLTAIDGLDTLMLAGLGAEAGTARGWAVAHLRSSLANDTGKWANVFETTIRVLGGLNAAAALAGGDEPLTRLAGDLALRLSVAFATPTRVPLSDVNLGSRIARHPEWSEDSSVSEASTLTLEFAETSAAAAAAAAAAEAGGAPSRRGGVEVRDEERVVTAATGGGSLPDLPPLSDLDALAAASSAAAEAQRVVIRAAGEAQNGGLAFARFVSPKTGAFVGERVASLGARADSYYEYLLKGWLQSGKADAALLSAWRDAEHAVTMRLLARSAGPKRVLFVGEVRASGGIIAKMDHLVCFYPGLLALSAAAGAAPSDAPASPRAAARAAALASLALPPLPSSPSSSASNASAASQIALAEELAAGCRALYEASPLHLGAEIGYFDSATSDVAIHPGDGHSLLRPEYVESLFVLWRVTRNPKYRDWGWDVAVAIQRHARVPAGGYASVQDVAVQPGSVVLRDHMESFFLAETLKYLYLLFDDDPGLLPLDKWVFNTEAHPTPVRRRA